MSHSSSTTGSIMAELASLLAAGLFLLGMGGSMLKNAATQTRIYTPDESAFPNAQIGYAPMTDSAYAQDSLLRYVELRWREVEPQEGVYAWDALDAQYGFRDLRARGIHVVTHVILCLPGEGREEMLQTARYVGQHSDGIKLQLLHVLEGTDLAADYRAGRVPLPTLEEYVALVRDCVKVLPEDMVVHRMTGDGPKRMLLAPQWSGDKKRVLNALNWALERS